MFSIRAFCAAVLVCAATAPAMAGELAPDAVKIADGVLASSLTGAPGDPAAGRKAFADRKLGNCLACHADSEMSEQLFHGNVGPELDGVASRYNQGQIRAIVVNSKAVFGPDTVMPGFYSLQVGKHVAEKFVGKTILTAAQVEDIVAYLSTLK